MLNFVPDPFKTKKMCEETIKNVVYNNVCS